MIRRRTRIALIGSALMVMSGWAAPTVASAELIRAQAHDVSQDTHVRGAQGTSVDGWVREAREDSKRAQIVIPLSNGQNG
jgi:hypothetical protein